MIFFLFVYFRPEVNLFTIPSLSGHFLTWPSQGISGSPAEPDIGIKPSKVVKATAKPEN